MDQPVGLIVAQPIERIVLQLIVHQQILSHALHGSMPTVLHQALPPVVAPLPALDHLAVQVLAALRLAARNLAAPLLERMRPCFAVPIARSMIASAT